MTPAPIEKPKPCTPAELKKAADKLEKLMVGIILDHPFFAVLLMRLERVVDETCETAWTDSKRLGYSPRFINGLKPAEAQFVLMHEIMHCIMHHTTRRGQRDPKQWNVAADYAVNQVLVDSGFTPIEGALLEPAWADLSAEQIYAKIYQPPPPGTGKGEGPDGEDGGEGDSPSEPGDGDGKGNDPGKCGECRDNPNAESELEKKQAETEQDIETKKAANCAKAQGKLPGSLEKLVAELLEPKCHWKDELREFITAAMGKTDQSWARMNRRFVGAGTYLPGYFGEELPPIVCAFDTSGSVSQKELDQMTGELNGILSDFPETSATAIYCDAKISDVIVYNADNPLYAPERQAKVGRGGTSFEPPFEWVRDNMDADPAVFIYLTDMESCFPRDPGYPVLWVSTQKGHVAPFGRTIVMQD